MQGANYTYEKITLVAKKCLFHPTCVTNLQTLFDYLSKSQSGWILLEFWKPTLKKKKDPCYPRFRVSYAIGVEWKKGWK
jgi:hypothetical protein